MDLLFVDYVAIVEGDVFGIQQILDGGVKRVGRKIL
jgi:hypothetical protein